MRRIMLIDLLVLAAAIVLYLLLWPVPIDPVAWDAPVSPGYTGDFEGNDALANIELVSIAPHEGPEDIAIDSAGRLYTGTEDGKILRISPDDAVEIFADTGGRPLGLEFDANGNLVVANAYLGLQRVAPDGSVTLLSDKVGDSPIRFADDLDILPDGRICFSDASTRFGAADWTGTYSASLLDILEHGGHGRVLLYDPANGQTTELISGLNFANGVAADPAGRFILVNETGTYRVLRHWLTGNRAGATEVLIDNLPGFPDNINRGRNGLYWIGLVAPRSKPVDALSSKPFLRRVVQRLPEILRPSAEEYSHLFAIDEDGNVIVDLQGDGSRLPSITGALETADTLHISSLFGSALGRREVHRASPTTTPQERLPAARKH